MMKRLHGQRIIVLKLKMCIKMKIDDVILVIGVVTAIIMTIIVVISIITTGIYTSNVNNNIEHSKMSIESHTIVDIQSYSSISKTYGDQTLLKYDKYPTSSKIKYEVTLETGEIIGTSAKCLQLNETYMMYIYRSNWQGNDVVWFDDCYLDRS